MFKFFFSCVFSIFSVLGSPLVFLEILRFKTFCHTVTDILLLLDLFWKNIFRLTRLLILLVRKGTTNKYKSFWNFIAFCHTATDKFLGFEKYLGSKKSLDNTLYTLYIWVLFVVITPYHCLGIFFFFFFLKLNDNLFALYNICQYFRKPTKVSFCFSRIKLFKILEYDSLIFSILEVRIKLFEILEYDSFISSISEVNILFHTLILKM